MKDGMNGTGALGERECRCAVGGGMGCLMFGVTCPWFPWGARPAGTQTTQRDGRLSRPAEAPDLQPQKPAFSSMRATHVCARPNSLESNVSFKTNTRVRTASEPGKSSSCLFTLKDSL